MGREHLRHILVYMCLLLSYASPTSPLNHALQEFLPPSVAGARESFPRCSSCAFLVATVGPQWCWSCCWEACHRFFGTPVSLYRRPPLLSSGHARGP